MRIAILAPIAERVPPPAYGGIELIVSLLADGLADRGHDVTLFATGDSLTRARLASVQPRPLRTLGLPWYHAMPRETLHVANCFEQAAAFDLIHNHVGPMGLSYASFVKTPVLTTLHGPFDEHNREFFEHYRQLPYVSISDAQRQGGPSLNFVRTVYNGVDTRLYHVGRKQGYLLHIGRLSPEKGTHIAVEVARRLGHPLILAGKVDPVDQAYYEAEVRPLIDGELVRFIGEVGGQPKADLLAGADALLHPVQWPEPFGLVMAEAMASGTPVIAFPLGSIPEVVEHGVTGYVVDSPAAMAAAVARAMELDPETCRRRAIERFDAGRMVAEYEEVYRTLRRPRASSGKVRPVVLIERMVEEGEAI